jgi:hypothetical protein
MNKEYKDFIGVYTDVLPAGYCKHVVTEFEKSIGQGAGTNRINFENAYRHEKDDIYIDPLVQPLMGFDNNRVEDVFFKGLQHCWDDYTQEYSVLKELRLSAYEMKMQRTAPGGGYHLWHFESSSKKVSARMVVYILYLNTLEKEEGGETEFLYQKRRVQPVENTLVLWPASYTHTHRGNLVIGNNHKYIATGWFYLE